MLAFGSRRARKATRSRKTAVRKVSSESSTARPGTAHERSRPKREWSVSLRRATRQRRDNPSESLTTPTHHVTISHRLSMSDRKTIVDRRHRSGRIDTASAAGPTVDRRQRRHQAKPRATVAQAWKLPRRDGLAAISQRDLADRVDLRQPSLYAYFDSKLALYDAMFADGYRRLVELLEQHPPSDDPREALVEFVELCVRFATEDVVRHQLLFQRTLPGFKPSPESHEVRREFLMIGAQRLTAAVGGVADPDTGDIFTGIVVGFTHQQVFNDPTGDRWIRLVRRAMEMFLADVDRRAASTKTKRRTSTSSKVLDRKQMH